MSLYLYKGTIYIITECPSSTQHSYKLKDTKMSPNEATPNHFRGCKDKNFYLSTILVEYLQSTAKVLLTKTVGSTDYRGRSECKAT